MTLTLAVGKQQWNAKSESMIWKIAKSSDSKLFYFGDIAGNVWSLSQDNSLGLLTKLKAPITALQCWKDNQFLVKYVT
jgi:hypothetical protein